MSGRKRLFAVHAPDAGDHGLAVIPLGGDDGKEPLVEFGRWKRRPSRKAIAALAAKFPTANLGIVAGLSAVTIVDPDEPELVEPMLRRFGTTPLIVETPRRGAHLWYRSSGERCPNLREAEGLPVDIKGIGGIAVVPPSVAWDGPAKGRAYRFLKGSWADLAALPQIIPGSLPVERKAATVAKLRAVSHGIRNHTLTRLLLRQVRYCDTEADLLNVATTIVDQHFELYNVPPFPPQEIGKIVDWVWRLEKAGNNWTGGEARLMLTGREFLVLQKDPDALTLYLELLWSHGGRDGPFAIAPKAMAKHEIISGWRDHRRYMRARDFLVANGFISRTHTGGTAPGDASLYGFPPGRVGLPEDMGAVDVPNITRNPPAPLGGRTQTFQGRKRS